MSLNKVEITATGVSIPREVRDSTFILFDSVLEDVRSLLSKVPSEQDAEVWEPKIVGEVDRDAQEGRRIDKGVRALLHFYLRETYPRASLNPTILDPSSVISSSDHGSQIIERIRRWPALSRLEDEALASIPHENAVADVLIYRHAVGEPLEIDGRQLPHKVQYMVGLVPKDISGVN